MFGDQNLIVIQQIIVCDWSAGAGDCEESEESRRLGLKRKAET